MKTKKAPGGSKPSRMPDSPPEDLRGASCRGAAAPRKISGKPASETFDKQQAEGGRGRAGSNRQQIVHSIQQKKLKARRKPAEKFEAYDYEEAYNKQLELLDEQYVQDLLKRGQRIIYATKKIKAGTQFELEIYPEFAKSDRPAEWQRENHREAQRSLNNTNSRKQCERTINANFTTDDIWITLTYDQQHLPKSFEEAQKNMRNYIARLNYRRKKRGLPPARYVYVTEWETDAKHGVRCHHHIVMDGLLDMDEAEKAWKLGKRNEARRLDYDDHGLSGLGAYITKSPRGVKKWCASVGLKKPDERKNHTDFTRRKIAAMVKDFDAIRPMVESKYPAYWYTEAQIFQNETNRGYYIHVRMRRRALPGQLVQIGNYKPEEGVPIPPRGQYRLVEYSEEEQKALVRQVGTSGKGYIVPARAVVACGG